MNQSHANGAASAPPEIKVDTSAAAVDEKKEGPVIDAGLRSLDHYRRALPGWRYDLRQRLLPLIRWETPYLALLQEALRTPFFDSYFAITANLGTHTFFMIGLPILFWCGYPSFGKGLVHILAAGVFFTGFVKDFFSLPRPLSPPLHRITMSGSAALEYGFPSTHSANAVSVAVYGILMLHSPDNTLQPNTKFGLEALAYFYTVSIIFGRLYCGMHGFLDVIIGSVMGAVISLIEFYYGPAIEMYLREQAVTGVLVLALIIVVLIRVHPEPADDCPCFDDSVAFAGVVIGVEIGTWHFSNTLFGLIAFDLEALGWPKVIVRILIGVFCVVAWREVAKPALLKSLPYVFRAFETWGVALPRRFFMPASEYKNIPLRLRVDNMMPDVSEIPKFVNSIRKGGRGRSVSIGPQSAADAYETLAYRERRRRESIGSNGSVRSKSSIADLKAGSPLPDAQEDQAGRSSAISGAAKLNRFEHMMGEGIVAVSPSEEKDSDDPTLFVGQQDELGEREVFAKLVKPRVRYDVEVVTKLVVYSGIGLVAVDIVPIMFHFIGLGAGHP
ncbi:PAP2 superfamily protein [Pestalotiopsis sp. NC0098]|nr:PAP2 superfamily protein [Pestalotiopsis sp. NC0098]